MRAVTYNLKGLKDKTNELSALVAEAAAKDDVTAQAVFFREAVFAKMGEVRAFADTLEKLVEKTAWPFPTYEQLLFVL